jgi:uncharacterized protein YuzE
VNDLRVPLRATYDPQANAVYIYFKSEIAAGEAAVTAPVDPVKVRGMVNVELDDGGRLLGLEVLDATSKLPEELLRALGAL